ncbi:uncharacterized protein AC631_01156 [Debaryomyces fabryi]|uniref:Transcription factor IIIC subunit 5 HTH domain-containing protein n=1 Tax=Debaryomyces fabryi TaxID=58627 RepID=A0A0V1Q3B1_9ASCO|nr:uncharacterized protein AC631_01156 [Debaryomyces fabryi]KSA03022.1 hypothetical protein AC631_01156 [Debaryomyces fabryi]CUM49236.1 unnamed protein product [Debaryomyces fabryi]
MTDKRLAEKHSMDIPHVAAVELPLIVKNEDKAIEMIGGKEKIYRVVNALDKPINTSGHSTNDNVLELRLRNDPFHHPIQSLMNTNEKVLLKVSIPKKSIPKDYYKNPSNYTVKQLLEINEAKNNASHKVQPVAIINKTFLFKAMADFQVSTKNNALVQEFNESVLNVQSYQGLKKYFDKHEQFSGILDYKLPEKYLNNDHQLPPPPVFSPIRFPFDYKYQKNPLTTIVKDANSGEVRVVSKKNTQKLYTIIIDFYTENIPNQAAPELLKNYETLLNTNLAVNSLDYNLLECIKWLKSIFDIKPIWLRKQLEDIVPQEMRRVIKQALPYVSYIYKSGPWRFCNVKFGVNPKENRSFWKHQSEYFRIPGLHFNVASSSNPQRIIPNSIEDRNENGALAVSDYLLFTGLKLPRTVTYQVGDILDTDIISLIQSAQEKLGDGFYRDVSDFQDGWINKQTMETIRRIIRYKLSKIVKEEPIESAKVEKIINTDFTENEDAMEVDVLEEDEIKPQGDEDVEEEEEDEENDDMESALDPSVTEENVLSRLNTIDDSSANKLEGLLGFIKQDSLLKE